MHMRIQTALLLLVLAGLVGCQSGPPPTTNVAAADEKLGPGDLIGVRIQGISDPPTYEGPIDDEGNIEMLYVGKIKAAGYTEREFAERIKYVLIERGLYPMDRVRDMLITVVVGTRFYYITGEASRGRYPMVGPVTVCKALLSTGGVSEEANLKKVIVHRGTKKIYVNCNKARDNPKYDLTVKAGDIIEVPKKGLLPFL
jgi:protein involved in polysaccharide export with SLBB domain